LFFSYFSTRAGLAVRKILQFGYAVDRPVESVKSCYSYCPLLYYDYRPFPGIRDRGIELLLISNIAPKFEDTEHKETCLPSLSGPKGGVHKTPSGLLRLHNAVSTVTLVILFCSSYRIYTVFPCPDVFLLLADQGFSSYSPNSAKRCCILQSSRASFEIRHPSLSHKSFTESDNYSISLAKELTGIHFRYSAI
jgi:hypothetical protein